MPLTGACPTTLSFGGLDVTTDVKVSQLLLTNLQIDQDTWSSRPQGLLKFHNDLYVQENKSLRLYSPIRLLW